jgi:hypothetical protein
VRELFRAVRKRTLSTSVARAFKLFRRQASKLIVRDPRQCFLASYRLPEGISGQASLTACGRAENSYQRWDWALVTLRSE